MTSQAIPLHPERNRRSRGAPVPPPSPFGGFCSGSAFNFWCTATHNLADRDPQCDTAGCVQQRGDATAESRVRASVTQATRTLAHDRRACYGSRTPTNSKERLQQYVDQARQLLKRFHAREMTADAVSQVKAALTVIRLHSRSLASELWQADYSDRHMARFLLALPLLGQTPHLGDVYRSQGRRRRTVTASIVSGTNTSRRGSFPGDYADVQDSRP
ncbi:hypothetical protein BV20DRAFT_476693 [Pilatotrama ljubarskyi]|nr:hypothetical protein BV20DRAFT_476693 [Pilatotrama ljubarskyi]